MRIACGIHRDAYGYRVIWPDQGHQREKRFPRDAPLDKLKAYRARQIKDAQDLATVDRGGSFVRDVARYLRLRKGRPSFKSDRAHLRPWVHAFKRGSRWAVTPERCAALLAAWSAVGLAPRTIRHRARVLRELYHALDGKTARTPVDDLELPRIVKARPIAVPASVVSSVALELWKHEQAGVGWLRSAKTRARYLVLATTGQRPAQVKRAQPLDVDLERGVWYVRPAKGDAGSIVWLNADMTAAWRLFIAAQAWGSYDARSFAKTLRRCGWPKGVRPYNLRHSVGLALSERGVDLGEIQAHMGHADLNTTRRFYVPAVPARQQAASAAIDHQADPWSLQLPGPTASARQKRKRNLAEFPSKSGTSPVQAKGRLRGARSSKSA